MPQEPLPYPISPTVGSTIDPKNAIGRDPQCAEAFALLAHNNLLVGDPRRMGKSVWNQRMALMAPEGFTVVQIDYEGALTVEEFLTRTLSAIREHTGISHRARTILQQFIEEASVDVKLPGVSLRTEFRSLDPLIVLERALIAIDEKLDSAQRLVIAGDEISKAVENIAKNPEQGPTQASGLLQKLRSLRHRRESNIRWIITGSIGFHHVLRIVGATEGDINDLHAFPLGPLDHASATLLAQCLLLGINRPADERVAARMATISDGIPYLIHHLAHVMRNGPKPLTPVDVDSALNQFIEDRDGSKAVTHFVTRLNGYYAESTELAERVLDHVAIKRSVKFNELPDELREPTDTVRTIVDWLQDDHYLITDADGALQWRYGVIRKIWMSRRRLSQEP